jgi:hypothetical protein
MIHQGTPVFMARAAVKGYPIANGDTFSLSGLPQLSDRAYKVYKDVLPERLAEFPQPSGNQARYPCLLEPTEPMNLQSIEWLHKLHHDAESAFWLLVWWAVHIRPITGPNTLHGPGISTVPSEVWMQLTNIDTRTHTDSRPAFLQSLVLGNTNWLDEKYQELGPLFEKMAMQIESDLHWANRAKGCPPEMLKPDFMHEALQRILFDFLLENTEKPFMTLQAHEFCRMTEDWVQQHTDTTTGSECTDEEMKRSDERVDEQ